MIQIVKLLDVATVANKLSVSDRTVYRMLKDPDCPLEGVTVYKSIKVIAETVSLCLTPIKKYDKCDNSAMCDTAR